jgi:hypothetical protein
MPFDPKFIKFQNFYLCVVIHKEPAAGTLIGYDDDDKSKITDRLGMRTIDQINHPVGPPCYIGNQNIVHNLKI